MQKALIRKSIYGLVILLILVASASACKHPTAYKTTKLKPIKHYRYYDPKADKGKKKLRRVRAWG